MIFLLVTLLLAINHCYASNIDSFSSLFMVTAGSHNSEKEGCSQRKCYVEDIKGLRQYYESNPVFVPRVLPGKLIVGYANWDQCDDKILDAVKSGVNVVIWFAINLITDKSTGSSNVKGGPDMLCVAKMIERIRTLDPPCPTTHLISIGGWNAPHPDTAHTAEDTYKAWHQWNTETIISEEHGFYGFDGFDWDIEGNDDEASIYNRFTVETLDLMGVMSQMAKRDGYIVAMAPMESYLDPSTSEFHRDVTFPYDEWSALQPDFKYHGRNLYTYLLSKYGKTRIYPRGSENRQIDNVKESMMIPVEEGVAPIDHPLEMELHPLGGISKAALDLVPLPLSNSDKVDIDTFDFVTLQLYEGYSHVLYQTKILKQSQHLVLIDLIRSIYNGWVVDFTSDTAINWTSQTVSVNKSRLVLGLANGWAGDGKFLLLQPEEIEKAYTILLEENLEPRGFAFWNILDEGKVPPATEIARPINEGANVKDDIDGKEELMKVQPPLWLADRLNQILHVRKSNQQHPVSFPIDLKKS